MGCQQCHEYGMDVLVWSISFRWKSDPLECQSGRGGESSKRSRCGVELTFDVGGGILTLQLRETLQVRAMIKQK
jgi:hypothetical protein